MFCVYIEVVTVKSDGQRVEHRMAKDDTVTF